MAGPRYDRTTGAPDNGNESSEVAKKSVSARPGPREFKFPFVQMALQTEKNYFRINYAFHSRYRHRRKLFWNFFLIADADTAVLCSFEGAA